MTLVFYTGIGCKHSGVHTDEEFINIMFNTIHNIDYPSEWNGYELPDEFEEFSLDDWIEFSGATKLTQVERTRDSCL